MIVRITTPWTAVIHCTGGPCDGHDVEVEAAGGVVTRRLYWLAALPDRGVVHADDPANHDLVYHAGVRWTPYEMTGETSGGGVPMYRVLEVNT